MPTILQTYLWDIGQSFGQIVICDIFFDIYN